MIQDLLQAGVITSTVSLFDCPLRSVLKLGKNEWCLTVDDCNLSAVARQTATLKHKPASGTS